MPSRVHDIAANPDTLVILKTPTTDFALWEPQDGEEDTQPDLDGDVLMPVEAHCTHVRNTTFTDNEIHYRVSSQHLMHVSPRFTTMLSGSTWAEGVRSEVDGMYHITIEDYDEDALLTLFNIIHHRNKNVPRKVTLEMLTKVAVLVDYWDCIEVVEILSEVWIEDLRKTSTVPGTYCRDTILWLCVSWVFKLASEFDTTTRVVVRKATGPIRTLGLPIPPHVIDKLDDARNAAIEMVMTFLDFWQETLGHPDYECSIIDAYTDRCGCYLLGVLTRGLYLMNLRPVRPVAPFEGRDFVGSWCRIVDMRNFNQPIVKFGHSCTLAAKICTDMAEMEKNAKGLLLAGFQS
ncbi:hypothetical protein P154DRAFT_278298 [Amniculicola lignicola CBS 123094]|uniref:BTB domain-containing protein n=1 Tax=Amniculicola lignicola CBS 123094 TaxID=1392246 RepID=A0A6A5WBI1_9PLEO|nr:hypothetical protein P154DRAFT_278298 [Amniculicola lignicola CBS 123094]